jgi:hypothetical protein
MERAMSTPSTLVRRREQTAARLSQLLEELTRAEAPSIVEGRACVYATGSVGRNEMSARSDLDIFIVRDRTVALPLTNLEEIRLKARLIESSRKVGFPDFSDDGEYVKSYDVKDDLIEKIGSRTDDYENVFTARLLLLLESQPILGGDVYNRAIEDLVGEYWRDYPQNATSFLPVFLMNDILRFWKTLCLNYEERTADAKKQGSEAKIAKRRLLNYKLKCSRLLTCYSAIIHLLAVVRSAGGTVTPEMAKKMVLSSPTVRLEFVADALPESREGVARILENYAKFLDVCDADKSELVAKFSDAAFKRERFTEAKELGDDVFKLLHLMGEKTELLRYIVV